MGKVLDIMQQETALAAPEVDAHSAIAPRPTTIEETGLSENYLADLIAKHLLQGGALTIAELSQRLALAGSVVEEMVMFMRQEARLEVLGASIDIAALRFSLTDRGRNFALDALMRSSYSGPAAVPLEKYVEVVRAQSIHGRTVTREMIENLFAGMVLDQDIRDQLGLSMNSGRAVFIYGTAGTGKTYVTSKLARLFDDAVMIPHAIAVGDNSIALFDPIVHKAVGDSEDPGWMFEQGHDPRFVLCERPVIVSGGELTAEMLDIQYDPATKEYLPPLQLKANNGVFIIDDMGRQRVPPMTIFNRWIVPMEEGTDYLALGAGRHFSVPFDEVLIFSTNMNPVDLADEAFLRRIGYKIEFKPLKEDEYRGIWNEVCEDRGVDCDAEVIDFAINKLHKPNRKALLPCHPRDLINIALDHAVYEGGLNKIAEEHVARAWDSYFVSLDSDPEIS
jgi:predicted ATPase with chaperone activity